MFNGKWLLATRFRRVTCWSFMEAMKMEHEVRAEHAGCVGELFFANGDVVAEGDSL